MHLDPYFDKMLSNPNLKDSVLDGVATFRCLSWAVAAFVFISGNVYILAPIIFIIYQYAHHVESIKYLLPYPGVYPWPISPNGFLYKCHYIYEIFATFSLFSLTSSIEPLFSLYSFQMIGQMREMTYRLAQIDNTNERQLRKCVLQYTTLMKCRNILQKIYGPIILWMMGTNAIILCALIFQLTQVRSIRYIKRIP
uniref:Olfactory receptor 72 n=1 Tax=Meteorus pulchricornis TaxID=51522 RepID=A0A1S5VFR2_9HYME|nr:olfactory receptor 72 [Meteorus pulchricornis]